MGNFTNRQNTKRVNLTDAINEQFLKMQKFLFIEPFHSQLSNDAKLLYSYLADRHQLSVKNNWVDENGDVFIYCTREAMGKVLNVGKTR